MSLSIKGILQYRLVNLKFTGVHTRVAEFLDNFGYCQLLYYECALSNRLTNAGDSVVNTDQSFQYNLRLEETEFMP